MTMKWLGFLWEKWKIFGQKIGNFQARLILTLFYFIAISPFAVVVKYVSKPLRLKLSHSSNWRGSQAESDDIMTRARRQF